MGGKPRILAGLVVAIVVQLLTQGGAWAADPAVSPGGLPGDLSGGNVLENGQLEVDRPGGSVAGWSVAGPVEWGAGSVAEGRRLRVGGSGSARLSQSVAVEPGQVYRFSMDVRSDGRAVAHLGKVVMAYHDQGQWQQVTGLVPAGAGKTLKVELQLASLDGKPTMFQLRDLVLRPAVKQAVSGGREVYPDTALVVGGAAQAVIVYPGGSPDGAALGERVRAAVEARAGVSLPVIADTDATDAAGPALRPEYRDRPLILIGRLGTNRALWPAYNRFLAAADGYYPGGDGYVVRTASNVMRTGQNHLVLGGSSDAGVARAVDRFTQAIASLSPTASGDLVVPWQLDVELGGACGAAVDAMDQRWTEDPFDPSLPPIEPGYNTVRRWYENAMAYYWTGRPSFEKRAREYLDLVLRDHAYTHHYIVEFLIRTYDMIDDSPLVTPEQRAGMDQLIADNFWDFQIGQDLTWMTTFSPPYDSVGLVNRHQIAPWMADLMLADFVHDYLDTAGDLHDVVEFRRSEKMRFMDHVVAERWGASAPSATTISSADEIASSLLRHALHHERYGFFETGHARQVVMLPLVNHRTGLWTRPGGRWDSPLMLGILAHYYRDGRYRTLMDALPYTEHPTGPFQGRYVAGIRRYTPGAELAPRPAESLAGVEQLQTMPHILRQLHRFAGGQHFVPKGIQPDAVLDFVAFRGGFDPADDYLALNGVKAMYMPGELLDFSSRGVSWLGAGDTAGYGGGTSTRYLDQDAVHVLRTDRWLTGDAYYAAVGRRAWYADLGKAGGAGLVLEPFMDTRWQRDVVWVRSGVFLVRDRVEALEPGQYEVAVSWWPAGVPSWDGRTMTARSGRSEFRITPLSTQLTVSQNFAAYEAGQSSERAFRHVASAELDRGDALTGTAVLQARYPSEEPALDARLVDPDTVLLTAEDGTPAALVCWSPIAQDSLKTDARLVVLQPGEVQAVDATHLQLEGVTLFRSEQPVSVRIRYGDGRIVVHPADGGAGAHRLHLGDGGGAVALDLPAGEHAMELPVAVRDAAIRAVAASLTRAAATPALSKKAGGGVREALEAQPGDGWREAWTYTGLDRPARVEGVRSLRPDVVDLGREVALSEIRAVSRGRVFEPAPLPQAIWVAPGGNGLPAADSPAWRRIEAEPVWRRSIKPGNYGRAEPLDEAFQVLTLDGVRARYVRAEGAAGLMYFDADTQRARRTMELQLADVDGDAQPEVFVRPTIWPKFIRPRQEEDDMVALIGLDGRERFQRRSETNYQDAAVLDYLGQPGRQQVVLTNIDGLIEIVDAQGQPIRTLDTYAMHEHFNATEGRPNTRHPAGGLTMPYALGLWRRGADGTAGIVMSRYGALTFIDPSGAFQGVLMPGGYVTPMLLPHGTDLDGDGSEDQLMLARGRLVRIGGDPSPRVTDPNGAFFYPQIYEGKSLSEPAWDTRIDGSPTIAMRMLTQDDAPPTAFVARENYLGFYDGRKHDWSFTWTPLAKLEAADARASAAGVEVLASTADGLLWRLSWGKGIDDAPSFQTWTLSDQVNSLDAGPGGGSGGRTVLAGNQGLYLFGASEGLTRIAEGAYADARFVPGSEGRSIVAVTAEGAVKRFDAAAR